MTHKINYISEIYIRPQLSIMLSIEEQLEAIHTVPPEFRITHNDATGGLVKIPKNKEIYPYQRILNYMTLLKVIIN